MPKVIPLTKFGSNEPVNNRFISNKSSFFMDRQTNQLIDQQQSLQRVAVGLICNRDKLEDMKATTKASTETVMAAATALGDRDKEPMLVTIMSRCL